MISKQINETIPGGDKQEVEVAGLGWVTHMPHACMQRPKDNTCGGSLSHHASELIFCLWVPGCAWDSGHCIRQQETLAAEPSCQTQINGLGE